MSRVEEKIDKYFNGKKVDEQIKEGEKLSGKMSPTKDGKQLKVFFNNGDTLTLSVKDSLEKLSKGDAIKFEGELK